MSKNYCLLDVIPAIVHSRSSKWSQEEVDMLKNSVTKFNEDLNQLSSHIKAKQTSQIRQTLKNKSYTQAGLVPKVEPVVKPTIVQTPVVIQEQVIFHHQQPSTIKIEHQLPENLVQQPQQTTSHMTLNRLNAAHEEEMDVESEFQNEVKIETSYSEVS